jgi:hypothetical protein
MTMSDWLEEFWGDLLSEEPLRISAAWTPLDDEEKATIHAHLMRMVTESGWLEVQRAAAATALRAIGEYPPLDGHKA